MKMSKSKNFCPIIPILGEKCRSLLNSGSKQPLNICKNIKLNIYLNISFKFAGKLSLDHYLLEFLENFRKVLVQVPNKGLIWPYHHFTIFYINI